AARAEDSGADSAETPSALFPGTARSAGPCYQGAAPADRHPRKPAEAQDSEYSAGTPETSAVLSAGVTGAAKNQSGAGGAQSPHERRPGGAAAENRRGA